MAKTSTTTGDRGVADTAWLNRRRPGSQRGTLNMNKPLPPGLGICSLSLRTLRYDFCVCVYYCSTYYKAVRAVRAGGGGKQ
jgi:hypothetical protein